jgi:hypothetical protein
MKFERSEPENQKESENTEPVLPSFKACYQVQNINIYSNALSQLPEFARERTAADAAEQYIWMAPVGGPGVKPGRPVATIRLSGQMLEIHSESHNGLQALRVLVEELGGSSIRLISSFSAKRPI